MSSNNSSSNGYSYFQITPSYNTYSSSSSSGSVSFGLTNNESSGCSNNPVCSNYSDPAPTVGFTLKWK